VVHGLTPTVPLQILLIHHLYHFRVVDMTRGLQNMAKTRGGIVVRIMDHRLPIQSVNVQTKLIQFNTLVAFQTKLKMEDLLCLKKA